MAARYGTVGVALSACNHGDTVVVCPGWYREEVIVDRAVRLESWAGAATTYLKGAHVTADGARVAGLRLRSLEVEALVDAQLLGNYLISTEIYLPLVLRDEWQ
jgi:nitrous oxidase accessory protein NosD